MNDPLTFKHLNMISRQRNMEKYGPLDSWSLTGWACALAGEAGEFCNWIKKIYRGDAGADRLRIEAGKELADIVIYADLCASRLGFDLEDLVREKFNEVSVRIDSRWRL